MHENGKNYHTYRNRDKKKESLHIPLSEEDLNAAADTVYGKDLALYEEGRDYDKLKCFLTAGTSQDWIEVIEKQEGTVELLPEQLLTQYRTLRIDRLFIEANDLLVPEPFEGGRDT